jgi:Cse1
MPFFKSFRLVRRSDELFEKMIFFPEPLARTASGHVAAMPNNRDDFLPMALIVCIYFSLVYQDLPVTSAFEDNMKQWMDGWILHVRLLVDDQEESEPGPIDQLQTVSWTRKYFLGQFSRITHA